MMCKLPYLPQGREILYVSEDNEFMQAARQVALEQSLDKKQKVGSVIVKDGKIVAQGANGSYFHKILGCVRRWFKVPTGHGYWMCPGCQPRHHSEASALKAARRQNQNVRGADIYLWGHWWCCQHCWAKMIAADIARVFLVKDAAKRFK